MTLEENVLAYLDGSLGEEESAELLHTLSTSPEKRAVLEEHLRMNEMLSLGRKPFAVPAATESQLVTRLPFLAGPVRTVPFYAKPVTMIASAAAVLAVVGGLWWNANRVEMPAVHNAVANAPLTNAPVADAPVSVQNDSKDLPANDIKAQRDATDVRSPEPVAHLARREHVARQIAEASTHATESSLPLQANSSSLQASATPAATPEATPEATPSISAAALRANAIPFPSMQSPRTLHEIAFGVPERLRPFSIGASSMASGYYFPTQTAAANSTFGMDPQLNINYDITQWFAFGVEAGYMQFGQVTNTHTFVQSFDGTEYSQLSFATQVVPTSSPYVRAALRFTVDPAGDYPVHFGAAGGYAFVGTSAPCASVSTGITRTLSDDLSVDLDLVLSGLWSTQVDQYPSNITGVTGIAHNDTQSQAPFTSAFGLRAGIRYRP